MSFEAAKKAVAEGALKYKSLRQKLAVLVIIVVVNVLALIAFQGVSSWVHQIRSDLNSSTEEHELMGALRSDLRNAKSKLKHTMTQYQRLSVELSRVTASLHNCSTQGGAGAALIAKQEASSTTAGESDDAGDDTVVWRTTAVIPGKLRRQEAELRSRSGGELQEFVADRKFPLGWNPSLGTDSMMSSVGHGCLQAINGDELERFMSYEVGGLCPDDDNLAQRLLLKGCEPLPRRRLFLLRAAPPSIPSIPACIIAVVAVWLFSHSRLQQKHVCFCAHAFHGTISLNLSFQ
jgi:hypothetical protein